MYQIHFPKPPPWRGRAVDKTHCTVAGRLSIGSCALLCIRGHQNLPYKIPGSGRSVASAPSLHYVPSVLSRSLRRIRAAGSTGDGAPDASPLQDFAIETDALLSYDRALYQDYDVNCYRHRYGRAHAFSPLVDASRTSWTSAMVPSPSTKSPLS